MLCYAVYVGGEGLAEGACMVRLGCLAINPKLGLGLAPEHAGLLAVVMFVL